MIQLPGMGRVRGGHVSLILKQTRAIEASVGVWPILHGLREGISWWLEEVVHRAYVRAQAFRSVSDLPAASPCDAGGHTFLLFLDLKKVLVTVFSSTLQSYGLSAFFVYSMIQQTKRIRAKEQETNLQL
jgi:hypothetical protein